MITIIVRWGVYVMVALLMYFLVKKMWQDLKPKKEQQEKGEKK